MAKPNAFNSFSPDTRARPELVQQLEETFNSFSPDTNVGWGE